MKTNAQVLMPDDDPREIIIEQRKLIIEDGGHAQEIVEQAKASINDVLQTTTAQVRGAMEQLKDTIKGCEAKICAEEDIQVIVKPDQMIFSIKRKFEMLKDK